MTQKKLTAFSGTSCTKQYIIQFARNQLIITAELLHSSTIKCHQYNVRCISVFIYSVHATTDLTINTKMRHLRCYIFSVLFYGVESWTMTEATTKQLESSEMWLYRRTVSYTHLDVYKRQHLTTVVSTQKLLFDNLSEFI